MSSFVNGVAGAELVNPDRSLLMHRDSYDALQRQTSGNKSFFGLAVEEKEKTSELPRAVASRGRDKRHGLADTHPVVLAADAAFFVCFFATIVVSTTALVGAAKTNPASDDGSDWQQAATTVSVCCSIVSMAWVAMRFFVQSRRGD